MKSNILKRDYPLSETKMSEDEKKKAAAAAKELDQKKSIGKKVAGVVNTTRSNIRNTAGVVNTTRSNIRNMVLNKGKEEMKNKGM